MYLTFNGLRSSRFFTNHKDFKVHSGYDYIAVLLQYLFSVNINRVTGKTQSPIICQMTRFIIQIRHRHNKAGHVLNISDAFNKALNYNQHGSL